MDLERTSVGLAVVATVALVFLAAVPYALFYSGAVGSYYAVGILDPRWIALLALVTTLTLAAGLKERSDPATMAGVSISLSVFGVFLALSWWLPARAASMDLGVETAFGYHPHGVLLAALVLLVSAGSYAYSVLGGR